MKKKYLISSLLTGFVAAILLGSCQTIPNGAIPVKPFDKDKYLGLWYEIARFDFRFEKNLNHVTATYTLNENGTIKVVNRGYDATKNIWKESIGKAKFAGSPYEGRLKVSFFGPFYAAYNVIAIDKDYKYALVAGKNLDYMWILSREKSIPESIKASYLELARSLGYKTENLIWVKQND